MKIKNLGTVALLGLGLAMTGSQAFAQDRDHWRDQGRREYHYDNRNYDRRGDWDRDRDRREREYWRERERRERYDRRGYYETPYYYEPAPQYYRPGFSGYLYFGRP